MPLNGFVPFVRTVRGAEFEEGSPMGVVPLSQHLLFFLITIAMGMIDYAISAEFKV